MAPVAVVALASFSPAQLQSHTQIACAEGLHYGAFHLWCKYTFLQPLRACVRTCAVRVTLLVLCVCVCVSVDYYSCATGSDTAYISKASALQGLVKYNGYLAENTALLSRNYL